MTDERKMDSKDNRQRLRQVLSAYGADRARWPAEDRRSLAQALDLDAEMRAFETEAREIDALLSSAPVPAAGAARRSRAVAGVLERIGEPTANNVVPLGSRKPAQPARRRGRTAEWPAATLIAASLVLGIALGQSTVWDDVASTILLGEDLSLAQLNNAVLGLQITPETFTEDL